MAPASYHKKIMALVAFTTTSLKAFACIWALVTFAVGASFVSAANDSCRCLFFQFVLVFSTDSLMIIWLSVGNHFVTHTDLTSGNAVIAAGVLTWLYFVAV